MDLILGLLGQFKYTVFAITVSLPLLIAVMIKATKQSTTRLEIMIPNGELVNNIDQLHQRDESEVTGEFIESAISKVQIAKDETMTRASHFENLLVAMGGMQLAIVAFLGSEIFTLNQGLETPETINVNPSSPQLGSSVGLTDIASESIISNQTDWTLFFFAISLLITLAIAYLHSFKIYMGYATYALKLEVLGSQSALRPTHEVFHLAQDSAMPGWCRALISAGGTISIVAIFPMTILLVAIFAFGTAIGIDLDNLTAFAIFFGGWAIAYITPIMAHYLKVVSKSGVST